jgi:two-component system, LuxR family, sensor kinase FixL
VTFQFDPSVDFVLIDKVQVQQVLLNLLRNAMEALKASDRREPVVSTAPAADDMIAVSIADTGAGIDPRIASQLFQPFITTKREGTGIGLSISRSIIESHGSEITMEPIRVVDRSSVSRFVRSRRRSLRDDEWPGGARRR